MSQWRIQRGAQPGGGGVLPYVCILGMCRMRDPIFSPEFPFRSITILHFLPFRRQSFSNFLKFQPVYRLPRPAQPERKASWQFPAETCIFTLKTAQARSGAPHFPAQNGSSSFRSPAFSRSTGSSFRSPGPFFTLPRHIPTKIWGEYPPPLGGGGGATGARPF